MARVLARLIKLTVAGENRADQVSSVTITSAESDRRRLGQRPERDYALNMRIAQDHTLGSLWDLVWSSVGSTVSGIYAPHGNAVASAAQPHFAFTARIAEPDGTLLGATAPSSLSTIATTELTWPLLDKPEKRTS